MKLTRRNLTIPALVLAGSLGLAACSSATGSQMATHSAPQTATPPPATTGQTAPVAQAILPAVTVRNVRGGQSVDLATLTQAGTPTLVWAWAPHCPYCNAEAPKVQKFATDNVGKVNVVGVGTQDSFGQAEDFVAKHDLTTPTMVWDESFKSWTIMGISSMPTWILLGPDGNQLLRWAGQFPESDIQAKI